MAVFHDEVEIEDFEYDEDSDTYYYPCPCGDQFQITRVSESTSGLVRVLIHNVFRRTWRMGRMWPSVQAVLCCSR